MVIFKLQSKKVYCWTAILIYIPLNLVSCKILCIEKQRKQENKRKNKDFEEKKAKKAKKSSKIHFLWQKNKEKPIAGTGNAYFVPEGRTILFPGTGEEFFVPE